MLPHASLSNEAARTGACVRPGRRPHSLSIDLCHPFAASHSLRTWSVAHRTSVAPMRIPSAMLLFLQPIPLFHA
jgi:hypothetical protein